MKLTQLLGRKTKKPVMGKGSLTLLGQIGGHGLSIESYIAREYFGNEDVPSSATGIIATLQSEPSSNSSGLIVNGVTGTIVINQIEQSIISSCLLSFSASIAITQENNSTQTTGSLTFSGTTNQTQSENQTSASGSLQFISITQISQSEQSISSTGFLGFISTCNISQKEQSEEANGVLIFSGEISENQKEQSSLSEGIVSFNFSGTLHSIQEEQIVNLIGTVVGFISGNICVSGNWFDIAEAKIVINEELKEVSEIKICIENEWESITN